MASQYEKEILAAARKYFRQRNDLRAVFDHGQ